MLAFQKLQRHKGVVNALAIVNEYMFSAGGDGELVELIQLEEKPDKLSKEALTLKDIFNEIIEEGQTYPQLNHHDETRFRYYYLSHAVYALRLVSSGTVIGGFYVKPNFPGRCSHICNAGFIVDVSWRGKGAGRFMAEQYKLIAPELGYRASMFNLVFVSNQGSLHLWDSLGFSRILQSHISCITALITGPGEACVISGSQDASVVVC